MARVWIVNPFDPLPGGDEQSGRYATLSRMLRDAGHAVTWWTASFSHRFKREIDPAVASEAARCENIDIRLISTRAYERNISVARILSHCDYARGFAHAAATEPAPDVIIVSTPPPEAAATAARVARQQGAKLIVDVQDFWIDPFRKVLPRGVRWAWRAILFPWIRALRTAYAAADAVVGVAGGYADEPRRFGRPDYRRVVIPLGAPLDEIDAAIRSGRSLLGDKPAGAIRVIYSGSLAWSYDVMTIARVAADFHAMGRAPFDRVRFVISGRGELEAELRKLTGDLPNVTFLGFASFADWAATLAQCDIGWNAIRPGIDILLPNKIFFYWSAGLAVLNSIPGECADWVTRTESGANYPPGDANAAGETLERMASDPTALERCKAAARRAAEEIWDRRRLYKPYVQLVKDLSSDHKGRDA